MCLWGASREDMGLEPLSSAYGQHHVIGWGLDGVKEKGLGGGSQPTQLASLLLFPSLLLSPHFLTTICERLLFVTLSHHKGLKPLNQKGK